MYYTNKYAIIINLFATLHDAPARAADSPLLLYSIYLLLHKFLLYQFCGPSCSSKHWYDAPAAHDPIARSHAGSRSIAHYAQNNLQTDELTHIRVDNIK